MAIQFDCPSCGKRTQAPDDLAGKKARCPLCQNVIRVPSLPEADDGVPVAEAVSPGPSSRRTAETEGEDNRRPCPMCGELIRENAIRCRYCGEELDEGGPVSGPRRRRRSRSSVDSDLSAGDWVLAILCSGIGCIMGIIWMIQGRPKGAKMFGVSVAMNVFWGIVRAVAESVLKH